MVFQVLALIIDDLEVAVKIGELLDSRVKIPTNGVLGSKVFFRGWRGFHGGI